MAGKPELALIMPVYNEEEAISGVVKEWLTALEESGADFEIHVYNDGSGDNTLEKLERDFGDNRRVVIHDKDNSGHGPTILRGYREHLDKTWLFQTDSDGEMPASHFQQLWKERDGYDFLIGKRDGRFQPLPRKIISMVSRMLVALFYRKGVWDVNSPYRLMRSEKLKEVVLSIPEETFAPNVIISGMVGVDNLKVLEIPVPHQDRQTGEVSIKKWKLLKAAARSFLQTVAYRMKQ